jgi:membrane-associated phospholipid phosphatase
MSRVSWPAAPGPDRPALAAPGRDAAVAAVAVLLTVGVFATVGDHGTLTSIQRVDDGWLRLMVSILMGLSRAYLGAHWLSDAVAGILLGMSCAVVTALIVGQIQRHAEGRQRPA